MSFWWAYFRKGWGPIVGESFARQKWFGLYLEDAENSVPEGMTVQCGGIEPPCKYYLFPPKKKK